MNLKTVQAWEDVVADLGQVLKLRGALTLQTPWGQDVSVDWRWRSERRERERWLGGECCVEVKGGLMVSVITKKAVIEKKKS